MDCCGSLYLVEIVLKEIIKHDGLFKRRMATVVEGYSSEGNEIAVEDG
jgi:hypothetical protein